MALSLVQGPLAIQHTHRNLICAHARTLGSLWLALVSPPFVASAHTQASPAGLATGAPAPESTPASALGSVSGAAAVGETVGFSQQHAAILPPVGSTGGSTGGRNISSSSHTPTHAAGGLASGSDPLLLPTAGTAGTAGCSGRGGFFGLAAPECPEDPLPRGARGRAFVCMCIARACVRVRCDV